MEKYALTPSAFFEGGSGPTLGALKHRLLSDVVLDARQKREAMEQLERETAGANDSTPLSELIGKIGGGVLGLLIARYFKMSIPAQVLATAGGYGIGKLLHSVYQDIRHPERNIRQWL